MSMVGVADIEVALKINDRALHAVTTAAAGKDKQCARRRAGGSRERDAGAAQSCFRDKAFACRLPARYFDIRLAACGCGRISGSRLGLKIAYKASQLRTAPAL